MAPVNSFLNVLAGETLPNLSLRAPVTLSALRVDTSFAFRLSGGTPNPITLQTGLLDVPRSARDSTTRIVAYGTVTATLAGSAGLTKTGDGAIRLQANNAFSGGTQVLGGTLITGTGDGAFGATGAGNGVTVRNARLVVETTDLTSARSFSFEGHSTLRLFRATTLSGVVGGSGLWERVGGTLVLTGANSFAGSFVQLTGGTTLRGAAGTLAAATAYDLGAGTFELDNASGGSNRLSDTAPLTIRGTRFTLRGSTERTGVLTPASGMAEVSLGGIGVAGAAGELTVAGLERRDHGFLRLQGRSLGAAPGSGAAQLISVAPVAGLVGGGGAAGSTTVSVLPWAIGNPNPSGLGGSSFLTADASGRFRPLDLASEYLLNTFAGATADTNVRIAAATAVPAGGAAVNALLVQANGLTSSGSDAILVRSGAVLASTTTNAAVTIGANLDFGSAEGVISSVDVSTLTLTGRIAGTGGLTLVGASGGTIAVGGANTYTGRTVLLGGGINVPLVVPADGSTPGAFGLDPSPVQVRAGGFGTNGTTLRLPTNARFDRGLVIGGPDDNGVGPGGIITLSATGGAVLNGALTLRQALVASGGSVAAPLVLNGVVSGPGSLSGGLLRLNGANTYSGGTELGNSAWVLGHDSGFGTGPLYPVNPTLLVAGERVMANSIVFYGGTLTVAEQDPGSRLTLTGPMDLNGSAPVFAISMANPVVLRGVIDDGGLTKSGIGTLTLARAEGNPYAGGTRVSQGTLNVLNSSGSGTGAGTVFVGTAGRLAGDFTAAGASRIEGALAPGDGGAGAIGTARFGNALQLTGSAVTTLELAGGASFDRLVVDGLLTLGGQVRVVTLGGYSPGGGTRFDLLDWGQLESSAFTSASGLDLSGVTLAPGLYWDSSQFLVDGSVTVVPEPGTWALLVAGMLAIGWRLRRAG